MPSERLNSGMSMSYINSIPLPLLLPSPSASSASTLHPDLNQHLSTCCPYLGHVPPSARDTFLPFSPFPSFLLLTGSHIPGGGHCRALPRSPFWGQYTHPQMLGMAKTAAAVTEICSEPQGTTSTRSCPFPGAAHSQ